MDMFQFDSSSCSVGLWTCLSIANWFGRLPSCGLLNTCFLVIISQGRFTRFDSRFFRIFKQWLFWLPSYSLVFELVKHCHWVSHSRFAKILFWSILWRLCLMGRLRSWILEIIIDFWRDWNHSGINRFFMFKCFTIVRQSITVIVYVIKHILRWLKIRIWASNVLLQNSSLALLWYRVRCLDGCIWLLSICSSLSNSYFITTWCVVRCLGLLRGSLRRVRGLLNRWVSK